MDPDDQNQQQSVGVMSNQPVQDQGVATGQQSSVSNQPTYQSEGQQVPQEPTMSGSTPMPEETSVGATPFAAEPLVPDASQATTVDANVVQPPAPEVPQTPVEQVNPTVPEQVNPVEPSTQFGAGGQEPSGELQGGGDNTPPQGI